MADNQRGIPFSSDDEGRDFPVLAKALVFDWIVVGLGIKKDHPTFSIDEVYIVNFGFILGCWKANISTSIPDGRYYEVTYNKAKGEAYVDTYEKTHNVAVKIG